MALGRRDARSPWKDRKSTRLNSSHTVIYTLSLHDALPIWTTCPAIDPLIPQLRAALGQWVWDGAWTQGRALPLERSEEHTSELQSHSDLHSFPTRRSSDLDHLPRHRSLDTPASRRARPVGVGWRLDAGTRAPPG